MGVRFECPAGHKLHVKAELAGKRGICPECGAKFVVPSFSGQRVAEDNGVTAAALPTSPAGAGSASVPPPLVEPAAWYIRPASGGQFGPADDETFAEWAAEGRVASDSWVWRNGWADWKAGGEALRDFNARPLPAPPAPPLAGFDSAKLDDEDEFAPAARSATSKAAVETSSADLRRAEVRRRKQQVRTISIVLAVVALAMLVALVVLLTRGDSDAESPAETPVPPAATAPAEPPAGDATAEPASGPEAEVAE